MPDIADPFCLPRNNACECRGMQPHPSALARRCRRSRARSYPLKQGAISTNLLIHPTCCSALKQASAAFVIAATGTSWSRRRFGTHLDADRSFIDVPGSRTASLAARDRSSARRRQAERQPRCSYTGAAICFATRYSPNHAGWRRAMLRNWFTKTVIFGGSGTGVAAQEALQKRQPRNRHQEAHHAGTRCTSKMIRVECRYARCRGGPFS
jgi:hypothetical protein